jgi:hypothetical protein
VQAAATGSAAAAAAADAGRSLRAALAPLADCGLLARCLKMEGALLRLRRHAAHAVHAVLGDLEEECLGCAAALLRARAPSESDAAEALPQLVALLGWPPAASEEEDGQEPGSLLRVGQARQARARSAAPWPVAVHHGAEAIADSVPHVLALACRRAAACVLPIRS